MALAVTLQMAGEVCREQVGHMTRIFPTILIVLDVAAAVVYVAGGDVRRFIYWMAAATLTATVTY